LEKLSAAALVVGENFHFGAGARGNAGALEAICAERGVPVTVVPALQDASGLVISSTRIRRALAEGDVALAGELLGRPPVVTGRVRHGQHLGRELGFPTANLETAPQPLIPPGVYWGMVTGGALAAPAPGMVSYSSRPTVTGAAEVSPTLEVHIPGRDLDLYDQRLCVHLLARHREIVRFSGSAALVAQLQQDRKAFESFLHDTQLPGEYIGCEDQEASM
jgi:riboflavin kinase / FMN adenylyltransferase